MKKYDYYYKNSLYRVSGDETERYAGGGEWKSVTCQLAGRVDPKSPDYDYGETTKETEQEAMRIMKSEDDILELRRKNGWYDKN